MSPSPSPRLKAPQTKKEKEKQNSQTHQPPPSRLLPRRGPTMVNSMEPEEVPKMVIGPRMVTRDRPEQPLTKEAALPKHKLSYYTMFVATSLLSWTLNMDFVPALFAYGHWHWYATTMMDIKH